MINDPSAGAARRRRRRRGCCCLSQAASEGPVLLSIYDKARRNCRLSLVTPSPSLSGSMESTDNLKVSVCVCTSCLSVCLCCATNIGSSIVSHYVCVWLLCGTNYSLANFRECVCVGILIVTHSTRLLAHTCPLSTATTTKRS